MDLFLFIVLSGVYIMVMHFAVGIKNEFNLFLMVGLFILAGVVGGFLNSFELGFVVGVVLTLLFW